MDNEEIKKLLQELKESSDESSAVRSRVVKIHIDTPAEADRRRKAREKEKAREERRLAEEKAKAEAQEEARRLEAERAAREAVEEAKREAKAGFASDLEKDIFPENRENLESEETGGSVNDLNLSWKYERPSLTSAFAREEDPLPGTGASGRKDPASSRDAEERTDPEDDFLSDEADFRSGGGDFDADDPEKSITGLPGVFGSLTDRAVSFMGGIRQSMKEDLSKIRHRDGKDEDSSAEAGKTSGQDNREDSASEAADGDDLEVQAPEAAGRDDLEAHFLEDAADLEAPGPAVRKEYGENLTQEEQPEAAPAKREYGPDEEWKRLLEEPPKKKKSLFHRAGFINPERSDRPKKEKKQKIKKGKKTTPEGEETQEPSRIPEESAGEREFYPAKEPSGEIAGYPSGEIAAYPAEEPAEKIAAYPAEEPSGEITGYPSEESAAYPSEEITGYPSEEPAVRNIEVIDLNENQNNKEAEVIPLEGSTGPLPDPAQLKKEGEKRRFFRDKGKHRTDQDKGKYRTDRDKGKHRTNQGEEKHRTDREKKTGGARIFLATHKKQLILAAVAIAVAVAAAAAAYVIIGNIRNTRHAEVEADEGLTVSVLEQPDQYAPEGDVRIRLKAPETIQSVTVNGENVVAEQGRNVEFTFHATGGTLDIMAVCTDKVRSAKVILAYVDSQPPAVTIREENGKITLNAEDTESGLDAVYFGSINGLSQIPLYEKYTEPLDMDPEKEISYYAQDLAGNKTTPVVVALTPAESIAFEKERYGMYPGSEERINLITTPANAFVNNLTLEAENAKVVQVEGDMMIRAMAEGDTKITATADGIPGVMASVSVSGQRKVTISAIGDCTLGTDENFSQNNSFNAYQALYGNSYFFEKVKGILGAGDSTFANFEGTLTTSSDKRDKKFTFKGDASYAQILTEGNVDVVTLANNHSHDYKEQGLLDTQNALEAAGVEWCEDEHIAYRDLNGVLTAYIGIYALENGLDSMPLVKSTIAEAKEKGADLIIVHFHWGVELISELDDFQIELAHTAVDEGANLVLGTHAHILQAIEKYNGAYIVYGLANFCFGGSSNPTSYDSIIWQQTFTFTADGLESEDDIAIIPCHTSGDLYSNNYQPVPVSGDAAASIMGTIDSLSSRFGQSYSQYMVDGTLWTDTGA